MDKDLAKKVTEQACNRAIEAVNAIFQEHEEQRLRLLYALKHIEFLPDEEVLSMSKQLSRLVSEVTDDKEAKKLCRKIVNAEIKRRGLRKKRKS